LCHIRVFGFAQDVPRFCVQLLAMPLLRLLLHGKFAMLIAMRLEIRLADDCQA